MIRSWSKDDEKHFNVLISIAKEWIDHHKSRIQELADKTKQING